MNTLTKLNQRGVAHLMVLILILLLVIFGFAGWKAWKIYNQNSQSSAANESSAQQKVSTSEDTPAALERISSPSNSYTVALPSGWLSRTCEGADILFLAPTQSELGKCDSSFFGAISISSNAGDTRSETDPASDPAASEVSVTSVTINRQPATKIQYTVSGESMIPVGTVFTLYQIFFEGNTYTIGTSRAPSAVDYVSQLDSLVRTFRFNS